MPQVTMMAYEESLAKVDDMDTGLKGPSTSAEIYADDDEARAQFEYKILSAKLDDDMKAEIKGPSASAGFQGDNDGASVMAGFETASMSSKVGILEGEAKGPGGSVGVKAGKDGFEAMARGRVASAEVKAGPAGLKVGFGADTGACIGKDGVEAKFLGTGFTIGRKTSVSLFGIEVSWSFW